MTTKIRIGAVSYLNTKPLVFGLTDSTSLSLDLDLPSRLADRLAAGDLDVALIPAVEYFRRDDYVVISDACIACRGPVLSVKLFCRIPPLEIKTLALDEGSRTSAAMVQILLRDCFGLSPRLTDLPIGSGLRQATADAVLLIGDRAIHPDLGDYYELWDLGDVWCRRTELPFVFAMWAARADVDLAEIDHLLSRARDFGLANLRSIADESAADVGLSPDSCLAYLRDNLYFRLGSRERLGLQQFLSRCLRYELGTERTRH